MRTLVEYYNRANELVINFMEFITPKEIINYIIWEHKFKVDILDDMRRIELQRSESYKQTIIHHVVEKLLILGHSIVEFDSKTSKFSPEISTLNIYNNLLIATTRELDLPYTYTINPIDETTFVNVIASMFGKCFRVIKSSLNLIANGCESEALSILRSLLEYECTIKILLDNWIKKPNVFKSFVKHSFYQNSMDIGEDINDYIKKECEEFDVKLSNDFINYGWLKHVDKQAQLNIKDGLLKIAGYSMYNDFYTVGSKNIHSSGSILFENKQQIYFQAIINLYYLARDNYISFNQYLQYFFPLVWSNKENYYIIYRERLCEIFTEMENKYNFLYSNNNQIN